MELLEALVERAPEAIVVLDGDRRYRLGNRAARGYLGVSREELLKRRVDDFAVPERRSGVDAAWAGFIEQGFIEGVRPLLLANGLRRNFMFRGTANVASGRHVLWFRVARSEHQVTELRVGDRRRAVRLTARERELLTLVARGSSAAKIAEFTVLSPQTVRTHLRNAMKKLGADTRAHAVALAIELREIDP
jgi:DNA-binding CsgD family transcriptional regulator